MRRKTLALTSALALSLAACNASPTGPTEPGGGSGPTGPTGGSGGGGGGGGGGPIEGPATAKYNGVYSVSTRIDLGQAGALPSGITTAINILANIRTSPTTAVINLIESLNVGVVNQVFGFICPNGVLDASGNLDCGVLKAFAPFLDDLIDDQVYQQYDWANKVAIIGSGIGNLAKKIDLNDDITVNTPSPDGTANITQIIKSTRFATCFTSPCPPNSSTTVSLSAASLPGATWTGKGKVTPAANAPIADADITIEDAIFDIPIGELLLKAAGPLIYKQFGGAMTLQQALVNIVPCATLAAELDNAIPDGLATPAAVQQGCEAVLGLAASQVEQQINGLKLNDATTSMTTAKLWDASVAVPATDYQSDRMANGKWKWTFKVGTGTSSIDATFEGDRTGAAQ
jgi:hypothetical protein